MPPRAPTLGPLTAALVVCVAWISAAHALETQARAALVVDQTTGTILLAKNAEQALPPASMSKLMTLNMLFEALEDGRVSLDTMFTVSAKASAKGGSKMFLRTGERVSVENLIRGIIVQSGNDACIVVAENLAGTEDDFARIMTARAQKLGMMESTFANSTGWPDPNHRMSARDLVFLANRLITEFSQYYGYFAEEKFTWDGITQENRNPILGLVDGADGLKTGRTQEAGFGLVASAKQGDRRVVLMITGLETSAARAAEADRLMTWAFRQFTQEELVAPGKAVAQAEVWLGANKTVPLVVAEGLSALIPYSARDEVTMAVRYALPIQAPVVAGTEIGQLEVTIPGLDPISVPVIAGADVGQAGVLTRMRAAARTLTGGWN
ncbi:MAG: D-alanyl-D-alanine carboxypeptidase family protein [Pseudomonadota bacterium]